MSTENAQMSEMIANHEACLKNFTICHPNLAFTHKSIGSFIPLHLGLWAAFKNDPFTLIIHFQHIFYLLLETTICFYCDAISCSVVHRLWVLIKKSIVVKWQIKRYYSQGFWHDGMPIVLFCTLACALCGQASSDVLRNSFINVLHLVRCSK